MDDQMVDEIFYFENEMADQMVDEIIYCMDEMVDETFYCIYEIMYCMNETFYFRDEIISVRFRLRNFFVHVFSGSNKLFRPRHKMFRS